MLSKHGLIISYTFQHLIVKHERPLLAKRVMCNQKENTADVHKMSRSLREYAFAVFMHACFLSNVITDVQWYR